MSHERDDLPPPRQQRPDGLDRRARHQRLRLPDRRRPDAAPSSTRRSTPASRCFDTSDTYGVGASEELLGAGPRASGATTWCVATKFGMDMGGANGPDWGARASRRYVRRAVEASLRRLGTDHIDLYQLHQPDLVTPIEETLEALTELVHRGQGPLRRLLELRRLGGRRRALDGGGGGAAAVRVGAERVLALQPGRRGGAGAGAASTLGISLIAYFPLAYGLLTGKYRRGEQAPAGQPARRRQPGAPARERRLGPHRGAGRLRRRSAASASSTSRSAGWRPSRPSAA